MSQNCLKTAEIDKIHYFENFKKTERTEDSLACTLNEDDANITRKDTFS